MQIFQGLDRMGGVPFYVYVTPVYTLTPSSVVQKETQKIILKQAPSMAYKVMINNYCRLQINLKNGKYNPEETEKTKIQWKTHSKSAAVQYSREVE